MRQLIFFAIASLTPLTVQAQSSLDEAYQREYMYLTSQRMALKRQSVKSRENFRRRIQRLRAQVEKLQTQVTQLSVQNDHMQEDWMELEKMRKQAKGRHSSLVNVLETAQARLKEVEGELALSPLEKSQMTNMEPAVVEDFASVVKRSLDLLRRSSESQTIDGVYLSESQELERAPIRRTGRVAAFVEGQESRLILGPDGQGNLKVLERTTGAANYFFDDWSNSARIEKAATWLESLADLGPLLFLAVMLFLVAGLFVALVRT